MANIVIIRDEKGIAAIEIREQSIYRRAYIVFKAFGDARAIRRGSDIPIRSKDLDIMAREDAANEIDASDRFTPEEKAEYRSILGGRVFHIDSYSQEFRSSSTPIGPGTGDVPGPGGRPVIVRYVDP